MCPDPSPPPEALSKALIGTWELLSRVDRTAAGERRIEPALGEDPVAAGDDGEPVTRTLVWRRAQALNASSR